MHLAKLWEDDDAPTRIRIIHISKCGTKQKLKLWNDFTVHPEDVPYKKQDPQHSTTLVIKPGPLTTTPLIDFLRL